ncbi:MAG: citrate/2-methylcitrate synthase [Myxococcales bacterium]
MRNLLSTAQTAKRLGVKVETVYAYVSRGVLSRTLADDGKSSLFVASEVDALARRGRPRLDSKRVGTVDVSLGTTITDIDTNTLRYRGYDVPKLAERASFESVAELLWQGSLPATTSWAELAAPHPITRRIAAVLPEASPALERFSAVTAALSCATSMRSDLSPPAVMRHGRLLIAQFVHSLPRLGKASARSPHSLAQLLWPRLSEQAAQPSRLSLLNSALILIADHELATSTFAARVAASTRADPFAVVLSGLGALSGPLHGKSAVGVHRLLREAASLPARELASAPTLQDLVLGPAFGHLVYTEGDPRGRSLLRACLPALKTRPRQLIELVLETAKARAAGEPNIDFALGSLAFAMDMPLGSTDALFAIARCAGFIAHALEEYGEAPLRFRARALYTG